MTAPSSKAGNDCDAFLYAMDGQGAPREHVVDIGSMSASRATTPQKRSISQNVGLQPGFQWHVLAYWFETRSPGKCSPCHQGEARSATMRKPQEGVHVPLLTIEALCAEATQFSAAESIYPEPSLYGVSDGKAIGTYLEHKFRGYLTARGYQYEMGNAANGLDFPGLAVDIKVTSIKQPQSSCPFRSIRQKVYGLGYSLLVFVYDKRDDIGNQTAVLRMTDTVFVHALQTADFQMTKGLREILFNQGNEQDLMAFMESRALTTEEHELRNLASEIIRQPPEQGFLTISPALQWRLQYKRVIDQAGLVAGVHSVFRSGGF